MRIDNLTKWIETTCASTLRIIEIRIRNRYTHSISIQLIVTKPILKTRWRETTEEGRKEGKRAGESMEPSSSRNVKWERSKRVPVDP